MYKRKSTSKSTKRHSAKRYAVSRPLSLGTSVHKFKRCMEDGSFYLSAVSTVSVATSNNTVPVWLGLTAVSGDYGAAIGTNQFGFTLTPYLAAVISQNQFSTLFNEYRITGLTVSISQNQADAYNPGAGCPLPTIVYAYDPNDASLPASQEVILQLSDARFHTMCIDRPLKIRCRPRPALQAYVSAVSTGYAFPSSNKSMWFDTTAPSQAVPHYAFKFWVRNFPNVAGVQAGFRVVPTLHFECRRTR